MFLVLELEFEFDVLDDFKSPSPLFSSSPCQFLLESLKSFRGPALEEDGPGLVDDHHLVIVISIASLVPPKGLVDVLDEFKSQLSYCLLLRSFPVVLVNSYSNL